MSLKVGDRVTWRSQARGSELTKAGEVVEVVPAGSRPDRERFPSLYKHSGCGFARNHESYVVMVGGKYPYWPRVSRLQK